MIVPSTRIYGCRLNTRDDRAAVLHDVLFDDQSWKVKYLVVRLRRYIGRHDVLLAPDQLEYTTWTAGRIHTPLSFAELKAAPRLLSDPPVAKQGEMEAARMIAWEAYWTGLFDRLPDMGDPHLRSTRAVTGHRVYGLDSSAGFIDNFIVDDQDWTIRYLIVRLDKHQDSRRVMVDPRLVDSISWENQGVWIRLPKESIERCEEFAASR